MSDIANKAVEGDKKSFVDFRKLTACGAALAFGGPAGVMAACADKSVFQKRVEYAVGNGEMSSEDGVDAMIDRGASHLTTMLHKGIEKAVNVGCRVAGGWIGHFFGPHGIVVGQQIGAKIAGFLNTNISVLVEKGVRKVAEVAKTVWHKGKELLKSAGQKIASWLGFK